jgi:hypothetical protein
MGGDGFLAATMAAPGGASSRDRIPGLEEATT